MTEPVSAAAFAPTAPEGALRALEAAHHTGELIGAIVGRDDSPPSGVSVGRIHVLSDRAIDEAVGETQAGNFALGYFDGASFTVFYVGRSDSDLNASLHAWVGAPSRPRRKIPSPCVPWRSRAGPCSDLGTRALGHIAIGIDTAYTHFAFRYARSAFAAFERECRDYHELGGSRGLDNRHHPEPPAASRWACPLQGSAECARDGG